MKRILYPGLWPLLVASLRYAVPEAPFPERSRARMALLQGDTLFVPKM